MMKIGVGFIEECFKCCGAWDRAKEGAIWRDVRWLTGMFVNDGLNLIKG